MKKLKGIANKVEHGVITYPGRLKPSESRTVHVLKFEVRGWPVTFESAKREDISEGDHVILAGKARSKSFLALAYRNSTTGAEGHESVPLWLAVGVVFSTVGILLPVYLLFFTDWDKANSVVGLIFAAMLFGGLFCFVGGVGFHTARKTWCAIRELREEGP